MRLLRRLTNLRAVEVLAGMLVLLIGGAATAGFSTQLRRDQDRDTQDAIRFRIDSVAAVLEETLIRYEDMLATAAIGMASQSTLSQTDFLALIARLESLPGATDLRLVIESRRSSWAKQGPAWLNLPPNRYSLQPAAGQDNHHYLIFHDSTDGDSSLAGTDLGPRGAHADARHAARANAQPTTSMPEESSGTIVVAAPILASVGQDDAGSFRGWVEAIVDPSALLAEMLGHINHESAGVTLTVNDVAVAEETVPEPQHVLAGLQHNRLGATWRADIIPSRSLTATTTGSILAVQIFGSALTLTVSGLVLFQAGSRRRALRLATTSTADLVDEIARRERQTDRHRQRITELELYSRQTAARLVAPLTAMKAGLVDTTDALISGNQPHAEELLLATRRTATNSVRLVDDLLRLASLDDNDSDFVAVDLNRTIVDVVAARENLWPGSSSYITIEPLPEVTGDEALLSTVLERLLENALTFVPPGDTPWVHIAADLVGEGWRGEQWRIEVTDRGIGMSEIQASQIFDISAAGSTDRNTGNHISLALCRKIIRLYGGDIGVEPNPVGGSVFWFTVPTRSSVRRFRRIKHRTRIRFSYPGKVTAGETIDLSEGGAMYRSHSGSTPAAGTIGDAEFELDGSTVNFRARVLANRRDAAPGEVRLEFITPNGNDLRIARRFIETTSDATDAPTYPRTERDAETILRSTTIDLKQPPPKARHVRR